MLRHYDPQPVEYFPSSKESKLLIVCDHAGRMIPAALQQKPLAANDMERHIAWDVNAKKVAQIIAAQLQAPLVTQRYSRLVIDMNRPLHSSQLIPPISDETVIPFNQNLTQQDKDIRVKEIFNPYHRKISEELDQIQSPNTALIAIHSFTPQLVNGEFRKWHVDLISRTNPEFVISLKRHIQKAQSDLLIGCGDVFPLDVERDFTLPYHGRKAQHMQSFDRN